MAENEALDLQLMYEIPLKVSAVLGYTDLKVSQIVKLARGSVIELDKKVGDLVDLYIGDRIVARGEIVVVENKIGINITEMVKKDG